MIQDFDETHIAETLDPLDSQSCDFDYEELYARLDADAQDEQNDPDLAGVVIRLLHMLLPAPGQSLRPERVGLRVIALAWVLSPGYFDSSPPLVELAQQCDVSPTTLGELTGEFSRLIGWRNRAQQRGWNWHRSERPPLGVGKRSGKARRAGSETAREGAD